MSIEKVQLRDGAYVPEELIKSVIDNLREMDLDYKVLNVQAFIDLCNLSTGDGLHLCAETINEFIKYDLMTDNGNIEEDVCSIARNTVIITKHPLTLRFQDPRKPPLATRVRIAIEDAFWYFMDKK